MAQISRRCRGLNSAQASGSFLGPGPGCGLGVGECLARLGSGPNFIAGPKNVNKKNWLPGCGTVRGVRPWAGATDEEGHYKKKCPDWLQMKLILLLL